MIRDNSFVNQENAPAAIPAATQQVQAQPLVQPETGTTSQAAIETPVVMEDQFDNAAVQGRQINRNDVMGAVNTGDGAVPQQASFNTGYYWNEGQYGMSPTQAYTQFNQFAARTTDQYFIEQGIEPAPMEVVDMNAQVRNDVLSYGALQNGQSVPNPEVLEQNMGIYSDLAGRHAMTEAGMDPYADPATAANFAAEQRQIAEASGSALHGMGYDGIGFNFNG
jgi:hypothetical protein